MSLRKFYQDLLIGLIINNHLQLAYGDDQIQGIAGQINGTYHFKRNFLFFGYKYEIRKTNTKFIN